MLTEKPADRLIVLSQVLLLPRADRRVCSRGFQGEDVWCSTRALLYFPIAAFITLNVFDGTKAV